MQKSLIATSYPVLVRGRGILGRDKPSKSDNNLATGRGWEGLETGIRYNQCLPCSISWSTGRSHISASTVPCRSVSSVLHAPSKTHSWLVCNVPPHKRRHFRTCRPALGIDAKDNTEPHTTIDYHPKSMFLKKALK